MAVYQIKEAQKNVYIKRDGTNISKLAKDWRHTTVANRIYLVKKAGIEKYGGKTTDKLLRIKENDALKLALFFRLSRSNDSMRRTDSLARIIFSMKPERVLIFWSRAQDYIDIPMLKGEILSTD